MELVGNNIIAAVTSLEKLINFIAYYIPQSAISKLVHCEIG